jgi:hypothetical protein
VPSNDKDLWNRIQYCRKKRPRQQQIHTSSYIAYAWPCSDSLAPAARALTDHHTRVRKALIRLLMDPVTDNLHQEVLRRVFGPDTKFDRPILDFRLPNLARLLKTGIKSVVWETHECAIGQVHRVLKPINCDDDQQRRQRTTS